MLENLPLDDEAMDATEPLYAEKAEVTGFFRDILDKGLSLRVKVTGQSMAPFLRGGEVVTIRKVPRSGLHKGDLIFVGGKTGLPLLLHRIVRKKRTGDDNYIFQTRGDAVMSLDEPVGHDEVLGKVCCIERVHPVFGVERMDMESPVQRGKNYIRALFCLFKSYRQRIGMLILKSGVFPLRRRKTCRGQE